MTEFTGDAVSQAVAAGAQYAEGRAVEQSHQVVKSSNGEISVFESSTEGLGVRVLVDGHWGFAGGPLSNQGSSESVKQAVTLAKVMPQRTRTVRLADTPAVQDAYTTPYEEDPFDVPLSKKVELAQSLNQIISEASDKVIRSSVKLDFRREISDLVTSEGSEIGQTLMVVGVAMAAVVEHKGQVVERSFPYRLGDYRSGGFELLGTLGLPEAAKLIVDEALELVSAPACDEEITTVILDPTMLGMVLHETLGHSTELDRVLGDEADNFGSSFLRPQHLGSFQYGSELVNITADATRPQSVATFGYDHEGVKAQKIPIIERGVLSNFLTSRECAADMDQQSFGTARASSWNRIPMVRITNLCLTPGDSSKEQLISETDNGLFIETFKGSDIDDTRLSFSFMGERGLKIRHGKIVGMVRNPVIFGETPDFWRRCTGIAGPDEDYVMGVAACGKGLPWQFVPTGQGGPPARFDQVKVAGI